MAEMTVEWVLSLLVGSVASTIAATMFFKYYKGRRLHHLLWALGLAFWGISAFGQGYAILIGWTVPLYKLYYFSAIALAGYLGAGTLGLIMPKRRIYLAFVTYIVALTAIFAYFVSFAAVDEGLLAQAVIGGLAFPSSVRMWTFFINIPGGITFIGGAAYSFVKSRKLFALLITLGALTPAVGGTLARLALPFFLPFTDFLGIVLLSAGVYLSTRVPRPQPQEGTTRMPT